MEQFAIDLKLAGTDRVGKGGKVKKFRGYFCLGCTNEASGPMVLIVMGGNPKIEEERESRNRQTGKIGLLIDRSLCERWVQVDSLKLTRIF